MKAASCISFAGLVLQIFWQGNEFREDVAGKKWREINVLYTCTKLQVPWSVLSGTTGFFSTSE